MGHVSLWDMKLAVIPLPNERGCEFVLNNHEVAPPIIFIGGRKQATLLVGFLLCLVFLVYACWLGFQRYGRPHPGLMHKASHERFDGSRGLTPGDLVLLNGGNSQVQKVAAAPKQAVLVRQGNALRGLYMAGESRYVVLSGTETRIVAAQQIKSVLRRSPDQH
jgi:hypothetical protein